MEWFKEWFDSKYYHILYSKRTPSEAAWLIDNLLRKIKPNEDSFFLDLGCGSGRHSIYLNKQGFCVDGFDVSKQSLKKAIQHQNKNLNFYLKDMRFFKIENKYDFVLNLFTSFGYFETNDENKKVFQNVKNALKKEGCFIVDYFNSKKVINELQSFETKNINNIKFEIHKRHDANFVYKEICVIDKKNKYNFTEKVRLINKQDFINYGNEVNMKLINAFGDYKLNKYEPESSERLLLIFKKR